MRYLSPSQIGTWNGWTEPVPPPPSFEQIRHGLAVEIDRELATLPTQQQTIIVAVCHVEEDAWRVDILNADPMMAGRIASLILTSTTTALKLIATMQRKYWPTN